MTAVNAHTRTHTRTQAHERARTDITSPAQTPVPPTAGSLPLTPPPTPHLLRPCAPGTPYRLISKPKTRARQSTYSVHGDYRYPARACALPRTRWPTNAHAAAHPPDRGRQTAPQHRHPALCPDIAPIHRCHHRYHPVRPRYLCRRDKDTRRRDTHALVHRNGWANATSPHPRARM